jgi:hypothetical protein
LLSVILIVVMTDGQCQQDVNKPRSLLWVNVSKTWNKQLMARNNRPEYFFNPATHLSNNQHHIVRQFLNSVVPANVRFKPAADAKRTQPNPKTYWQEVDKERIQFTERPVRIRSIWRRRSAVFEEEEMLFGAGSAILPRLDGNIAFGNQ